MSRPRRPVILTLWGWGRGAQLTSARLLLSLRSTGCPGKMSSLNRNGSEMMKAPGLECVASWRDSEPGPPEAASGPRDRVCASSFEGAVGSLPTLSVPCALRCGGLFRVSSPLAGVVLGADGALHPGKLLSKCLVTDSQACAGSSLNSPQTR